MVDINKNGFHFLRFTLAIIIFLMHLYELSETEYFWFLKSVPDFPAVNAFFIMSGFLVAKSFTSTPDLKIYFIKRFNRIVPAYLVVIFLSAIFLVFMSSLEFKEYYTNPAFYKYIAWNSIFLNFMAPYLPGVFKNMAVNGALWTIKVEEGFYVLIPIIFFLIRKLKNKSLIILLVIYIISALYRTYFFSIGERGLAMQLPGAMCYLISGVAIYLNFKFVLDYKKYLLLASIPLFLIDLYFDIIFFSPFVLGIVVVIFAYFSKIFNNFGKYGDFTYGVYIFHFPIIRIFANLELFDKYNPYLMAGVIFIIVLLCGFLSWHIIEKGFIRRSRRYTLEAQTLNKSE